MKKRENEWWRRSVVYQIYPKSFKDTTGDGIGDLRGIIENLDYLKELGIDVIWLTPIYQSPQRDNGYDISDYYSIYKQYGNMEDVDTLINEAHRRNIKIIMDMVVNHTSTEHEWFQRSRETKDNEYRNYYIWKEPKEYKEPNNWQSKFGGSAWQLDEKTGQYYLHLFDVTQADLNWENEEVRKKVYEIMHFWLDKGIDGFRLDVINLISKDQNFCDDILGDGKKFYTDGPKVHKFIHEINKEVFSKYNIMTVGEMASTDIANCIQYTKPDREELNMVFNFHHLKVDYPNGEKWADADFDFMALKKILSNWQIGMHRENGWNALFWCNHDQPRIISRYGDDKIYRKESAKMLATTIHMMQGTPYIYQGEEIGMINAAFDDIQEYRDVETLNIFEIMKNKGIDQTAIMDIIKKRSRDNSRTPMQWNSSENAGFSKGTPWIKVPSNYKGINVKEATKDEDSIFYHYKKLIQLRKQLDIITYGSYELIYEDHNDIFAYVRSYDNEKLLVINNFFDKETIFELPEKLDFDGYDSKILISNYEDSSKEFKHLRLRSYESIVYHFQK
jgi:trehalose-6-phosphate hydrolase